ncbi:MAG: hypothetical protein IH921_01865, partial [Gemmatimonadetes bacterium]|nr:hypothetical protein [Gemmatimonadota bacterium]
LQIPVSGTDTTAPVPETYIQPGAVAIGETVTLRAFVFEAGEVASITADIEEPDETVVATVTLFDDGQHNDFAAGDAWFAAHGEVVSP